VGHDGLLQVIPESEDTAVTKHTNFDHFFSVAGTKLHEISMNPTIPLILVYGQFHGKKGLMRHGNIR